MVVSRVPYVLATLAVFGLQHSITATPAAAQAASVTGWWAGVAPDSGLTYDNGSCSQDVTFVLQQQGDVISGDHVADAAVSGVCQTLRSVEQNGNLTSASDISGSISSGVLTLRIVRQRTFNGVPNQVLAAVASGAVQADRLTLTGTIVGPRTWLDANGNRIPDCDLAAAAANGECGVAASVTAIALTAVRLDSPSFLLDFETTATGAELVSTPFAAPDGTVTASAQGGELAVFTTGVGTGRFLLHDQEDETSLTESGQLAFDFDVSAITLGFDGFSAGEMVIEVLDADLNVIGSFFDPDTSNDRPGGPITLAAPGIRYLRWRDTDPNRVSAGIDNVSVSVGAATPEEQIEEIAEAVAELVADGTLSGGPAQSLTTRLRVAETLVTQDPDGAVGVLNSIVHQTEALVRRGILTAAQGQALIDHVEAVIAALQG